MVGVDELRFGLDLVAQLSLPLVPADWHGVNEISLCMATRAAERLKTNQRWHGAAIMRPGGKELGSVCVTSCHPPNE